LPESSSPDSPVLTLHVKPAERGSGVIVRLFNASNQSQSAEIGSGLLRIINAQLCDLLETPQEPKMVQDGTVTLYLPPRRVTTVLLNVEAAES
jgi:alpha-mannosidase